MANIFEEVIGVISQPSFKRQTPEIESVLPWLRKKSELLSHQETSVLVDIVRHCTVQTSQKDDLIIRQGDRGDCEQDEFCFYIILRGSASVYIDPKMTGEGDDSASGPVAKSASIKSKKKKTDDSELESEQEEEEGTDREATEDSTMKEETKKPKVVQKKKHITLLDRSKFGKFIIKYEQGQTFGEVALVHRDSFRNATIIADEETALMVVGQDLFDRSLRAEQENRYAEIAKFIEVHPFFTDMAPKMKKLLEMSLRKETYIFDTYIIKQGEPVNGLHFIIRGQAKVIVEPKRHKTQYIHLWPFEAGVDALAIEFEHLREARRAAILRKYEDPSVWETKSEDLVIRRTEGYAAIEKKMQEKHINLCTVQAGEVIGDVETLVGLGTYMHSVRCTSNTEVFVLDAKNFDRLVGKKNPMVLNVIREFVKTKLSTRMKMRNADLIPLLAYLHQRLTEQSLPPSKKVEPFKVSKNLPDENEEMQHLLKSFKEGKAELISPRVPGLVYYKEMMHDRTKRWAEKVRKQSISISVQDGNTTKTKQAPRGNRKPRSILEIRESLRAMMEAEVIAMENKKLKKKNTRKKAARPPSAAQTEPELHRSNDSLRRSKGSLSRSTESLPALLPAIPVEDKTKRRTENSLLDMLKRSQEHEHEKDFVLPPPSVNIQEVVTKMKQKSAENLPKLKPAPTLEHPKVEKEPAMPRIQEEKTQEEIQLRQYVSKPKSENTNLDNVETAVGSTLRDIPRQSSTSKGPSPLLSHTNTPKGPSPMLHTGGSVEGTSTSGSALKAPSTYTLRDESFPGTPKRDEPTSSVPSLPRLIVSGVTDGQPSGESPEQTDEKKSGASKWKSALSFVNENIQTRLAQTQIEQGDPRYTDFETSEQSLRYLENKIKAFHVKYGEGSKTKNLPPLRRYMLDEEEEYVPKPGGKVWIRQRTCKFANSDFVVKNHDHVRYHMVESIPEFESVKKTRIVMQQFLGQLPAKSVAQ